MKRLILGVSTALLFMPLSSDSFANQGAAKESRKVTGPFQASQVDPLQKLMQVPQIKERLEACRDAGVETKQLDKCLWDGLPGKVDAMEPKLRAEVSSFLKQANKEGQAPGKKLEQVASVVEHFQERKDPAIVKLEEYLSVRLRQALYGEVKDDLAKEVGRVAENEKKEYRTVDHLVFYELYNNQISQNIISSLSSYCLEADERAFYTVHKDEKKRAAIRKENLDKLQQRAQVKDAKTQDMTDGVKAYQHWNICSVKISEICFDGAATGQKVGYCKKSEESCIRNYQVGQQRCGNDATCRADYPISKEYCEDAKKSCDSNYLYANTRACATARSIRGARQAIMANLEVKDRLAKEFGAQPGLSHTNKNLEIKAYDPNDEKTSIQRIAIFSSGEITNKKNEYSATVKSRLERLKECYDGGKILDEEVCREFISEDREEQQDLLAEISMRTRAVSQQLNELEDQDAVKKFLETEGHSEEQITHLMGATTLDKLKEEINERYEAERQALIDQMAQQIEQRTVSSEGLKGPNAVSQLEQIRKELESQEQNFKDLVHFNNIIAGFLTITPDGKKKNDSFANTESILRELSFSAFNPELNSGDPDRAPSSQPADYFDNLNKTLQPAIDSASSRPKSATGSAVAFGVEDINNFLLKYKNSKSPEAKKE